MLYLRFAIGDKDISDRYGLVGEKLSFVVLFSRPDSAPVLTLCLLTSIVFEMAHMEHISEKPQLH